MVQPILAMDLCVRDSLRNRYKINFSYYSPNKVIKLNDLSFYLSQPSSYQPPSSYQQVRKVLNDQKTSPTQLNSSPVKHSAQNGNTGNLSELDTLLQDLSSARYGSNLDKYGSNTGKSSLGSQNTLNDSPTRPSVDNLLDELSSAQNSGPIYAVPNGWVN